MTVLGTAVRRGIGAGAAAGLLLVLGTAGTAEAVSAAAAPQVKICGKNATNLRKPPLALRFDKLHKVYYVGGSWSRFGLKAGNSTGARCAAVRPVLVFGARNRPLRQGDVRLQWKAKAGRGGKAGWHGSAMVAENGVLMGLAGPAKGLTLPAGARTTVPLRMRFATGAPTGQWLTLAIGYEPVLLEGQTVPLPVGVSDPHLFRVAHRPRPQPRPHPRPSTGPQRPQLAETGAPAATVAAAGTALLSLVGGAGLVRLSRRRSSD
ncbi:hypothetical protein [Streptacidiphilus sp. PAMC 29251]